MKLGIFAKTFERPTVEEVLEAVRAHNLACVQFNMLCAGLPSMPDTIEPAVIARIQSAAQSAGVELAAMSGTYNMIHPDPHKREQGLRSLRVLAGACRELGIGVITLCTGTRDPLDMWHWHPDNDSPQAWSDLLHTVEAALHIAEQAQVTLAFEPEHANVVNSAVRARALLDAMQSPRLKVVMDGANLIDPGVDQKPVLDEAFELLGEDIAIAHCKDRTAEGGFCAAGQGILNYEHYLNLFQAISFSGPLILHGLDENQVAASLEFLQSVIVSSQ